MRSKPPCETTRADDLCRIAIGCFPFESLRRTVPNREVRIVPQEKRPNTVIPNRWLVTRLNDPLSGKTGQTSRSGGNIPCLAPGKPKTVIDNGFRIPLNTWMSFKRASGASQNQAIVKRDLLGDIF